MKLSPPLTISAILVIGLVAATSMAPTSENQSTAPSTRVTIELPDATYTAMTLHVRDRKDDQGQPLTVVQWIANMVTAAVVPAGAPHQKE